MSLKVTRVVSKTDMHGTRIVIGISGGIAAYKIPHLIRLLRKQGAVVKVVLTEHALPLVGIDSLQTLCGHPVYRDGSTRYEMDHINLAQWADLLLIAPATANTIAKIAHGIADNLLTTLVCAAPPSRLLFAPAMNTGMWENPATRDNIASLIKKGYRVLPVGFGELACGDQGAGRMLEPEELVEQVAAFRGTSQLLRGKKVLISSGPTEEPIDPVRVLTNSSSGKMGAALAEVALRQGATVTVVTGPASESLPSGVTIVTVRTAADMGAALLEHFTDADICIMAAAVSDYRPAVYSTNKIERNDNGKLLLELIPNPDILADLGRIKGHRFLVGFALESGDGLARAKQKMAKKKCDLMVLNHADKALGKPTTQITLIDPTGGSNCSAAISKAEAAAVIISRIIELLSQR